MGMYAAAVRVLFRRRFAPSYVCMRWQPQEKLKGKLDGDKLFEDSECSDFDGFQVFVT